VCYAGRVRAAGEDGGGLLIAHCYTRFLGDLGGGPILKRLLENKCGLSADSLRFYDFRDISDYRAFAREYRRAIDVAAREAADFDRIVEEARVAFQFNIDLSEAVAALAEMPDTSGGFLGPVAEVR
jgi:heme oxygenase